MTPLRNKFFSMRGTCATMARLVLALSALLLAVGAHADPAGRIGRIGWLSGTVNLYNAGTGESFPVPLNQPLTSGDVLTAEPNARTEIQIGSMTVRLDSGSQIELTQVDDDQIRLLLKSGRAIAKLPSRDALGDFSLDTPDGRFTPRETGVYRFDADPDSSSATVYYGALHFSSGDMARDVRAGQSEQFWYDGQPRSRATALINDDFKQWSATRDRRPPSTAYTRYVSPEMTGAEDLDTYGNWSNDPDLGAIWFPRHVDPDWAPYRTGHWVWISPWGWNWVDNEPWGFAPFHYGRWVRHSGMWGWVPGARVVRPVYSPAMVAWIGTGGAGISIGIGSAPSVGWFPLAPREVYVPSYRTSANYVRNVNITHVTNITNITTIVNRPQEVVQQTHYANRNVPQAVTVVPTEVVAQRRPVASAVLSVKDSGVLRNQPIQAAAPVAAPRPDPQVEARNRQERAQRDGARRDNAPPDRNAPDASKPRDANPSAPVTAAPTLNGIPQRGGPGEIPRRGPQTGAETPAPPNPPNSPTDRAAAPGNPSIQSPVTRPPSAQPPSAPATGATPQRNDRPIPEVQRPAIPSRPESPQAPSEPRSREPIPPVVPPQVPPQRSERLVPEVQRPAIPSRQEPPPAPVAPRPREIEPAQSAPAPRVIAPQTPQRAERPIPEMQRPAPPPRNEPPQVQQPPREAARPAEPRQEARPAARPQRPEEKHQAPSEEELKRRRGAEQ